MNQPALDCQDARPEHVRALANQYAERHAGLENWMVTFFVPCRLLQRLSIPFRSKQGNLASGVHDLLLVLLPILVLTAVTRQWAAPRRYPGCLLQSA